MVLLAGLALSGCETRADRAMKNSPDYKAGYSDGCASAGSPGANMRDSGRVRDEQAYHGRSRVCRRMGHRLPYLRRFPIGRRHSPMPARPDESFLQLEISICIVGRLPGR